MNEKTQLATTGLRQWWRRLLAQGKERAADRLIEEGMQAERDGRHAQACERYRAAVRIAPGYAKAHLNLGIGLEAIADMTGATAAFEAAVALDSGNPYANYNLGRVLHVHGVQDRAARHLNAALKVLPAFPDAKVVLAGVFDAKGDLSGAADSLESALRDRPDYPGALLNYGVILRRLDRPVDAEQVLRRAVALEPRNVLAHEQLCMALSDQSRVVEAIEEVRIARRLAPDLLHLESSELMLLNFTDSVTPGELFAMHRTFGERLERTTMPRFTHYRGELRPDRRLRIGYVSGDFFVHPVALFMIPLLAHHDRDAFEVTCYSTGARADHITERLKESVSNWVEAVRLSDEQLADRIHSDGIDILVDLSGHTGVYRLRVFALSPAPVQVSWLGYLNTTGLTRIQYRLCDARSDPPGLADEMHTEGLVRLPDSQWCYRPFFVLNHARTPPLVRNGYVTFGSFNHPSKISAGVCSIWAAILRSIPDARLVFVGVGAEATATRLMAIMTGAGISPERVRFAPRLDVDKYYQSFDDVDIALDTMPYGGGTTTLDALWMGVPVIASPGGTPVSRSAASILDLLGLADWIGADAKDYVRIAQRFARDREQLSELRATLRGRLQASPLMDEPRFARSIENAYRGMWGRWCSATRAHRDRFVT